MIPDGVQTEKETQPETRTLMFRVQLNVVKDSINVILVESFVHNLETRFTDTLGLNLQIDGQYK